MNLHLRECCCRG